MPLPLPFFFPRLSRGIAMQLATRVAAIRLATWCAAALFALLTYPAIAAPAAASGGTLIVGMTAGDIPVTTGNPDQGFEGYRFVGYNLYDSLIMWDLSKGDRPSDVRPGLATSWEIDPNNHNRWTFHLRHGVTFHDGCKFDADAVLWNFHIRNDQNAPDFFPQQFVFTRTWLTNFQSVEKIDDDTIVITTKFVESLFPYDMSYVFMISPCRAMQLHYNWLQYATHPSGTGPYQFESEVPHQRLVLVPNPNYWDKNRIPKQDRLILIPMPEAATRTAALLSGQVNWIEAPSPDAIPRLKAAGMRTVTNVYPHDWPYMLNFTHGPFRDIRVREAANFAINRHDVVDLLGGTAIPEYNVVPPSMPYYGKLTSLQYDPKKAHELLQQSGCLPCDVTFAISTSGSGQMQPLPMNELVKSQLEAVGFKVHLDVMDWNTLLNVYRAGAEKYPNLDGLNFSRGLLDPVSAIIKLAGKAYWAPNGANWGHFADPTSEQLIDAIFHTFEPSKQLALLTRLHEFEGEQAIMIFVVHDLNPRAMSPKVHGFVQAQSWFQDLTPITVSP